jgi:hypothetical protein
MWKFMAAMLLLTMLARMAVAADDVVRFDFETGDLQGWRIVEGQFDRLVSDRDVFHNRYPGVPDNRYNKQGKYYLSTVEQQPGMPSNDRMTGVVESPVFVLTGPRMSMLVGAGTLPQAYVALCTLDGNQVLQARGKPHTEFMQRVEWSAPQLVGRQVFLRIVDRETAGWGHVTLDDFTAEGRIDQEATGRRWVEVDIRRAGQRLDEAVKAFNIPALRAAIDDLTATFPDTYRRGPEFLQRLERLQRQISSERERLARPEADTAADEARRLAAAVADLAAQIESLRREALLANPLVSGRPIVYVRRQQYPVAYHAVDTLFHTDEENTHLFSGPAALKLLDAASGETITLVETDAMVRDPEVHFDGQKIVFAKRRHIGEDYCIWEIQTDGGGLRQITSADGVSDFDPFYLPDDSIAFSSTREPKYNQCSRDIGANLFRMEPDGANIHQISKNNLFDSHGHLLPDGRILYRRWEYIDRNFGDAHAIWTVNPDGTNPAIYWGNNTALPGGIYYPRIVPCTQQAMCIFGMHHFRMWGALAIVDRRQGLDGRVPVVRTWPAEVIERVRTGGPFACDGLADVYPKYECPFPLSDKYFLVSRMTMSPGQAKAHGADARFGEEMAIYLVDVFGNELLVHSDAPGCYDPMPLGPRPRPPVVAARRDFENRDGAFYVADVYEGPPMRAVERGTVRWLRVVEAPEKRTWSSGSWEGQGFTAPGMNWHSLENKRILGTVPVEKDGSAYFTVPSDTFVYFQLLDENRMMIQSMRSGTSVQSGEQIGCVGCHDNRRTTLAAGELPLALRRPPSQLDGWYGAPREFSFMAEVQPIFDRHCVACHDYGQEAGEKLNLAADRTLTFNTAYVELWRKRYIKCVGAGPAEVQPAYSWGSHPSRLIQELRDPQIAEHKGLKLSGEDLDRLITWVDLNGVYYGTYATAYPDNFTGRCPLDAAQLARLGELAGLHVPHLRLHTASPGPLVSFDRPELSPLLAKFPGPEDPAYQEVLAMIRAGRAQLAQRPRADMPGFVPCPTDQRREEKYLDRRQIELRNRQAIREGRDVYDTP